MIFIPPNICQLILENKVIWTSNNIMKMYNNWLKKLLKKKLKIQIRCVYITLSKKTFLL